MDITIARLGMLGRVLELLAECTIILTENEGHTAEEKCRVPRGDAERLRLH